MDKEISLETALLAKQKGYNWKCDVYYHFTTISNPPTRNVTECFQNFNEYESCLSIPTQTSLQRWLREEKNLTIYVDPIKYCIDKLEGERKFYWGIYEYETGVDAEETIFYDTYEEALEAGLQEALKLI